MLRKVFSVSPNRLGLFLPSYFCFPAGTKTFVYIGLSGLPNKAEKESCEFYICPTRINSSWPLSFLPEGSDVPQLDGGCVDRQNGGHNLVRIELPYPSLSCWLDGPNCYRVRIGCR